MKSILGWTFIKQRSWSQSWIRPASWSWNPSGDQSGDHSSVLCRLARNFIGDLRRRNLVRMAVRSAPLPGRQTGGVQSAEQRAAQRALLGWRQTGSSCSNLLVSGALELPTRLGCAASRIPVAETDSDPQELCRPSGIERTSSSPCRHNESAEPCRHTADRLRHSGHGRPYPFETRSLSRGSRPPPRRTAGLTRA
jgi:hypothetical protein